MGIAGNGGGISECCYALACRIDAFKPGIADMAATAAIGRIARRIDDGAVANHLPLPGDALIILAKQSIRAGGTGFAVL